MTERKPGEIIYTDPKDREFPILYTYKDGVKKEWPRSIPWRFVEPHREQADVNHAQTLEALSERGGLSPDELIAVLLDTTWIPMEAEDAINAIHLFMLDKRLEAEAKVSAYTTK